MLYRIVLPYAVCGLIVEQDKIVEAAPIMRWTEGKHIRFVTHWVQGKNGTIENLGR